jgi:hypothetical protein
MKKEVLKLVGLLAYMVITLMVFEAVFGPMYR